MPYSKIYINESLSNNKHKNFRSLKAIAKNLGFKFIWHRGGKFLARWNFGTPEHSFTNPSELNPIKSAYVDEYHKTLHTTILTPLNDTKLPHATSHGN